MVFPHRRKYRKPEEIVHKKYVLSSETFEFGPLLCGKFECIFMDTNFVKCLSLKKYELDVAS